MKGGVTASGRIGKYIFGHFELNTRIMLYAMHTIKANL